MKQKRDKVFIWVTWLTGLISGDKQCEYASWLKAHYQYDKKPSTFDLTKWNIKHNQLVHKSRDKLEEEGYAVTIEDQNSFKITLPEGITVSGKADIIGLLGPYSGIKCLGVVKDCKTGYPKNSDTVQILLYMIFLPQSIKKYEGISFDGCVVYKDSEVPVPWGDVDKDLKEVVWDLIKRIGSDKPCRKVPSYGECRWCDISKEDCPERIE